MSKLSKWLWNRMSLGHLAGVLVLISAVGLAILTFIETGGYNSLSDRVMTSWYILVLMGSLGVFIMLMTELVNRKPRV